MLKVTIDLFSGRPNPTWIIGGARGNEILDYISKERQIICKNDSGYQGLGYRGIQIETFSDEDYVKIPSSFTIANGTLQDQRKSIEIAGMLIEEMTKYGEIQLYEHTITPISSEIRKIAMEGLSYYERDIEKIQKLIKGYKKATKTQGIRVTKPDNDCQQACTYEESWFNPGFWNNDLSIQHANNCYNYGRNWKTNTFAQPGRASGQRAASMSCPDVMAAAMRDGLHHRCDCLPNDEHPRRLMALVVAPGQDYHWYRKLSNGTWGHKPGGTAARNIDNSNNVIIDPQTCDRGVGTPLHYTDFCGFFYAGKSVQIA
jgi:hypothetical protein